MTHRAYVAERSQREPRFEAERDAAAAELALGELLVRRRDEWNLSLGQVAQTTGIAEERLEAIEEGESMTFHEVLWLLHALDLSVSIDAHFNVRSNAPAVGEQAKDATRLANAKSRQAKAVTA